MYPRFQEQQQADRAEREEHDPHDEAPQEGSAELDRAITELRASTGDAYARLKQVDADTLRVSHLREQLPQPSPDVFV